MKPQGHSTIEATNREGIQHPLGKIGTPANPVLPFYLDWLPLKAPHKLAS